MFYIAALIKALYNQYRVRKASKGIEDPLDFIERSNIARRHHDEYMPKCPQSVIDEYQDRVTDPTTKSSTLVVKDDEE